MGYNQDVNKRISIRLKDYDYSQEGLYFITICTQNKLCLFGEVVNNDRGTMNRALISEIVGAGPMPAFSLS